MRRIYKTPAALLAVLFALGPLSVSAQTMQGRQYQYGGGNQSYQNSQYMQYGGQYGSQYGKSRQLYWCNGYYSYSPCTASYTYPSYSYYSYPLYYYYPVYYYYYEYPYYTYDPMSYGYGGSAYNYNYNYNYNGW